MERGTTVERLFRKGKALLAEGKALAAKDCFQQIITQHHRHTEASALYGAALRRGGLVQESFEHLSEVSDLFPESPEIAGELALTRQRMGLKTDALSSLREALDLSPEDPDLHRHLGMVLAGEGRDEEAYRALLQSAALAEKASAPDPKVLGEAAMAAIRTGRPIEALALFEKALELDSGYFDLADDQRNVWEGLLRVARQQSE